MLCRLPTDFYEGQRNDPRCVFLSFQIFIQSKNNTSCHAAPETENQRHAAQLV